MLGSQDDESHTEYGVDARSESAYLFLIQTGFGDIERNLNTFAAADPVLLHGQNFVWPFF